MTVRRTVGCALFAGALCVAASACGEGSDADCDEAARQVAECLERYCDEDTGAFCGCSASGEHLETTDGCACEDGTVWAQMEPSVCEQLDGAPTVDCNGLTASIRRFERLGGCP